MPRIAVIGAGTIGASWAQSFAEHGWDVLVYEPGPAPAALHEGCVLLPSIADAVTGADLVQESTTENLALKRHVLREIADAATDTAVLASSTSTLLPSWLSEGNPRAAQIIVGHPFNPPHLMPLVEVVPGPTTSPEIISRAVDHYRAVGRTPVPLRREVPGFVGNRIQKAVLDEAISLIQEGVIDPAGLDQIMRNSLGLRWAGIGVFEGAHLGGGPQGLRHFLDHIGQAFETLEPGVPDYAAAAVAPIIEAVEDAYGDAASYAARAAERDRIIGALRAAAERSH